MELCWVLKLLDAETVELLIIDIGNAQKLKISQTRWSVHDVQVLVTLRLIVFTMGKIHLIKNSEKIVTAAEKARMDDEYQSLMKELGVSTADSEYPQMIGLPKGLVKDLPWINSGHTFLNSNDPKSFLGQSGPLSIANMPFNPDSTNELGAPYIPGAAPMPSFTVRTLLSQDNTLPASTSMPQSMHWPMYPGYQYPPFAGMPQNQAYSTGYFQPPPPSSTPNSSSLPANNYAPPTNSTH
ncbi:hypothetical protein MXB_3576 [Myxobolus squamalis]|nr:hypothetical protein MXB_3576 [Myxobolus squamalis]